LIFNLKNSNEQSMEKKKRGGKRKNAGAKAKSADEKKEQIVIYVKKSSIKRHGGKIALKELLTIFAESEIVDDINNVDLFGRPQLPVDSPDPSPNEVKAKRAIEAVKQKANNSPVFDELKIKSRIKELEQELKSPPKNPIIGIRMWTEVRQKELESLKDQLK